MTNNLFNYLEEFGNQSFDTLPFNEIDNLIFSNFAYIRLNHIFKSVSEISIEDAYNIFISSPKSEQVYRDKKDLKFFEVLSQSSRYKKLKLLYHHELYDQSKGAQFGAITIELRPLEYYIAFRGTDNEVVGWQEDLDLVFKIVPAQSEAVKYLQMVASKNEAKLYIGGHSKGGNLAIYAASHIEEVIYDRIIAIYNNDGPGFDDQIVDAHKIISITPKLTNYVPKTSIISVIMNQYGKQVVIDSSSVGIFQHDPYSWLIEENHFVTLEKRNQTSQFFEELIKRWLDNIDQSERKAFVEGVFNVIYASKAIEVKDVIPGIVKNRKEVQASIDKLDEKTKETISLVFKELWDALNSTISDSISSHFKAN